MVFGECSSFFSYDLLSSFRVRYVHMRIVLCQKQLSDVHFCEKRQTQRMQSFASDYGTMNYTLERLCNDKRETAVKDGRKQIYYVIGFYLCLVERLD